MMTLILDYIMEANELMYVGILIIFIIIIIFLLLAPIVGWLSSILFLRSAARNDLENCISQTVRRGASFRLVINQSSYVFSLGDFLFDTLIICTRLLQFSCVWYSGFSQFHPGKM